MEKYDVVIKCGYDVYKKLSSAFDEYIKPDRILHDNFPSALSEPECKEYILRFDDIAWNDGFSERLEPVLTEFNKLEDPDIKESFEILIMSNDTGLYEQYGNVSFYELYIERNIAGINYYDYKDVED